MRVYSQELLPGGAGKRVLGAAFGELDHRHSLAAWGLFPMHPLSSRGWGQSASSGG